MEVGDQVDLDDGEAKKADERERRRNAVPVGVVEDGVEQAGGV